MSRSIPQDNKRSRKFRRQEIKKSHHSNFKPAFTIAGLGLANNVMAQNDKKQGGFSPQYPLPPHILPPYIRPPKNGDKQPIAYTRSCFEDSDNQTVYCLEVLLEKGDSSEAYQFFEADIKALNTEASFCRSMIGNFTQANNCQMLNTWQGHLNAQASLGVCEINGLFPQNPSLESCITRGFNYTTLPKINAFYQGYDNGYNTGAIYGAIGGVAAGFVAGLAIPFGFYCCCKNAGTRNKAKEWYKNTFKQRQTQQAAVPAREVETVGGPVRRRSASSVAPHL